MQNPKGSFDKLWLKIFCIRGRDIDQGYKISGLMLLLAIAFRISSRYAEAVITHVRSVYRQTIMAR